MLDTTPRWLSITLVSSSSALLISGVGLVLNLFDPFNITPFTLLLHLIWAIVVSSWVLNLKVKLPPEKKTLLAIGVAVAVGSTWGAVQQWAAYLQAGIVNDITLVAGAVAMDAVGGLVVYILYHLNILGRKIGSNGSQSSPGSARTSPSL
ncbi:MAG: hypothetical protein AUI50_03900 [Crenarchaeota archaeon 13_1_40CM_2_52_14]|nr:MAG: hypothetical protein AUI50_03900 [Crenarchaeota archaeon 13_1_40CM_2_52_14]